MDRWNVPTESAVASVFSSASVPPTPSPASARPLARRALFAFLLVFIAARALVIGIMSGRLPDLFLHLGGTHVHHLNYGIFLLAAVGALTLFVPALSNAGRCRAAYLYGAGMALTFDEFGMWLHLGGSYWQRASYDAVVAVASLFALLAFAPRRKRPGTSTYWAVALTSLLLTGAFGLLLWQSLAFANRRLGRRLLEWEERGPQ